MTRAEAKDVILMEWRQLPAGERTRERAAAFAILAAKKYPFEGANPHGLIRLWLFEDMD